MKTFSLISLLFLFFGFHAISQIPGITDHGKPSPEHHFTKRTCIESDYAGNVWIGMRRQQNTSYSLAKFNNESWETFSKSNTPLPSDTINFLLNYQTKLYVATPKGIAVNNDGEWGLFEGNETMLYSDIRTLAVNESSLFAGTLKGLYEYHFPTQTWNHYSTANSDLISDTITTLQPTPDGNIWIGTKYGLSFFDRNQNQWTSYTMNNSPLESNQIKKLLLDGEDNIWVSNSKNFVYKIIGTEILPLNSLYSSLPVEGGIIGLMPNGNVCMVKHPMWVFFSPQGFENKSISINTTQSGEFMFSAQEAKVFLLNAPSSPLYSFEYNAIPSSYSPKNELFAINNLLPILSSCAYLDFNYPFNWYTEALRIANADTAAVLTTSQLWVAGKNENQWHISASTYPLFGGNTQTDYVFGPHSSIHVPYHEYVTKWNYLWALTKAEVDYHIANYIQPDYQMPWAIANWPAHGDSQYGQTSHLTPFKDLNGNTLYEPHLGEYPLIRGDKAVLTIANDSRVPNSSGGKPLNIEYTLMVYGFNNPNDSVLFNSLFFNYQIVNRSQNLYDSLSIGIFNDFELGDAYDDYIGCDTLLNAGFVYNQDDFDGTRSEFGSNPPAFANVLLNKNLTGFIGSFSHSNYHSGLASNSSNFLNWINLKWANGVPMVYGGEGYPGTAGATNQRTMHLFPGDINDPEQWHEINISTPPSPYDRKALSTSFIGSFAPGERICFDMAFVYARDYQGDHISSVALMKERIQEVQAFYNQNYLNDCIDIMPNWVESPKPQKPHLRCYPNPARDLLNIEYAAQSPQATYQIFDSMGKLMLSGTIANNTTTLSISSLKPGMYFLRVVDGKQVSAQKIIRN